MTRTPDTSTYNKGYGFIENDQLFLVRCYDCGRENYAMAVASGTCAWCGSTKGPYDHIAQQGITEHN